MKNNNHEKGTLTLETAIILPIFFFMFMCVFGFMGFVAARNQIHHALFQSAKSLSMDSYITEKTETLGSTDFKIWENLSDLVIDLIRLNVVKSNYVSRTNWYESPNNTDVVKNRFVAYLCGSGNDKEAQEKLESIGVKDGLKGMDFSYTVVNGDLKITLKYDLHLWLDIFGIGVFHMEDSVLVKMWGFDKSAVGDPPVGVHSGGGGSPDGVHYGSSSSPEIESSEPEIDDDYDDTGYSKPEAADDKVETEYSKPDADANPSVNEYSKPDGDNVGNDELVD